MDRSPEYPRPSSDRTEFISKLKDEKRQLTSKTHGNSRNKFDIDRRLNKNCIGTINKRDARPSKAIQFRGRRLLIEIASASETNRWSIDSTRMARIRWTTFSIWGHFNQICPSLTQLISSSLPNTWPSWFSLDGLSSAPRPLLILSACVIQHHMAEIFAAETKDLGLRKFSLVDKTHSVMSFQNQWMLMGV
jgi:hypothetical protein